MKIDVKSSERQERAGEEEKFCEHENMQAFDTYPRRAASSMDADVGILLALLSLNIIY